MPIKTVAIVTELVELAPAQMLNLQALLHDTLVTTGHVECCAIFKRKDCSVKATSLGYEVSSASILPAASYSHLQLGESSHYACVINKLCCTKISKP